jgi:hypothetical protein
MDVSHTRLAVRDRTLMVGLALGLFVGVAIGRKIYSPFVVVFLVALVFACAYGALRLTREARDAAGAPEPLDEEPVEA